MAWRHKKVLIITTLAPPAFGGTPTMIGRYFRYFPKNSYCFLADPLTKQIPHVSAFLPCTYYFFDGTILDGTKANDMETKQHEEIKKEHQNTKTRSQRLRYLIRYSKYIISDFVQMIKTIHRAYTIGLEVIKKEGPKHILAVSDNGPSLIVSYLLSKKTRVPYSVFLFDIYKGNFLPPARLLISFVMEKKIIKHAVNIFASGEGIREHYKKLYQKTCIAIPNSCDIPAHAPYVKKVKNPIRIVYTGALYWAQKESIERFRNTVKDLPGVTFTIYSHDSLEWDYKGVTQKDSFRIQKEADALLLPLSFNTGIFHEVIRTAPTGKLPEYLISGVPIIVHAPSDTWISRYMNENKAGIVIDDQSKESIQKAVEAITNDSLRKDLVKNAFKLAKKNHDVVKNSATLYNVLSKTY